MKKFFEDFKKFAFKGNMIDMAVGVLIATSFSGLVKSLTDNIISPLLGLLFQMNLDTVGLTVHFGEKTVFFAFGSFVSDIINFLLLALVLFLAVKGISKLTAPLKKKEETEQPKKPTTDELLTEIVDILKDKKSESEE